MTLTTFELYAGVLALFVFFFVVRSLGRRRRIPDLGSNEWMAAQQGLPPQLALDAALTRYRKRTRVWRIIGVIGGIVGTIAWSVHVQPRHSNVLVVALFIGWFAAGVLPELFVRNRKSTAVRVAALETRSVRRYITPAAWHWLAGSYALTAIAVGIRQVVTHRIGPTRAEAAGALCSSVLLALLGAVAVWRISRRPQPAGASGDVAVDEAIRSMATTRALSGWSALQFFAAGYLAPRGFFPHANLVHDAIVTVAFIGVCASWAWVPTRIVRRPGLAPATAASVTA